MKSIPLVVILLLTSHGIGVSAGAPQNNGSVEGTISRTNGDPISGVRVLISSFQATTNDEGFFSIPDLPPGVYPVSIERDGFVFIGGANRSVGRIAVAPGARLRDFHIEMVQTGTISGRVVKANGAAFTDGSIQLENLTYDGLRRYRGRVGLSQAITVDDRGNFRAFGIRPGEYYVYVEPRNEPNLILTYFPGTTDKSRIVPIAVREGEEASANFQILSGPDRGVTAVVTAPSSSGVTRFGFTLIPHEKDSATSESFAYRMDSSRDPLRGELNVGGVGMTAGAYSIFVWGDSPTGNYFGLTSVTVGDGRLTGISIPLHRGVDIPGRLVIEGDALAIRLSSDPVNLRSVTEIPFDSSEMARRFSQQQSGSGAGGGAGVGGIRSGVTPLRSPVSPNTAPPQDSFTIRSIPEGRYAFFPPLLGNGYLKDVRQGGKSILDSGLIVGAEQPEPLEVILSSRGGTVEGVLRNGRQQGMGFMTVALVPATQPQSLRLYKSSVTEYNGRFYFGDIAPGEYRLFAWLNAPYFAWTDPEFIKQYSDRGVTVSVKEDSRVVDVRLNLITN